MIRVVNIHSGEEGDRRGLSAVEEPRVAGAAEGGAPDIIAVADRTSSPMVLLDATGTIRYANPAAGWLAGRRATSLVGVAVITLVHPEDRERVRQDLGEVIAGRGRGEAVEYRIRAADGSWRTVSALASNLQDLSSTAGVLISVTDVTDQRAYEQSLRELALQNSITGLPNRLALHDLFLSQSGSRKGRSIVFIDIDHFRRVNECLGHTVGDTVLQAAGTRLQALVPPDSMLVHFGADSFVIVLVGLRRARVERLVWEMIGRLANPLFVTGHELRLSASAGVAFWDAGSTPESILRDADVALTRAKTHKRGGVEVFTDEMRIEAVERLALETDLRHAVERKEFSLHLQPVVRLSNGEPVGSEALVRWTRPNGVSVSPACFIPIAEETGLIGRIGDWVLSSAVEVLRRGNIRRLSVNLSPRQLLDPGLPARIERMMHTHRLSPQLLTLEVTEEVVIQNFELATECLNRLRGLGCPIGLDDFGTGYSSLGYLRRLPVDFLKLDRELVTDVDSDPQAAEIAKMIVSLASALSLSTIAEGIERPSQAEILTSYGCDYGQGWLFGRPEPA